MATNKIKMMMLVNLKSYSSTPQLLSTTHHSPLPLFINESRYCPSNKRQIVTCSSSKVPRFGIANPMASKEIMLLSTAQQAYTTTPFRSTTADHQSFDPSCDHLLVAVENSIKHAAHMADTALLEYLEKLEEKLSKANVFSPLLCTIKQLFTNMDKVVVLSELLLLAEKSSITLNSRKMQIIQLCNKRIAAENMQAEYWEEFPETPKEIFKAFRELIFADNNLRASLTDASTNKLIEDPNALTMFQQWGLIFRRPYKKSQKPMHDSTSPDMDIGPYAECNYTFYYGSNNQDWIDEFENKAKEVIEELRRMEDIKVHLEIRCIGKLRPKEKWEEARDLSELINIKTPYFASFWRTNPHADCLRNYFESASHGRFVLTKNLKKVLLNREGRKILKVLEEFQKWKYQVGIDGFEESFIDYYKGIDDLFV